MNSIKHSNESIVSRATKDEEFDRRLALDEEAIERFGNYFENFFLGRTKQQQDAEDLTSELFIDVLHKFPEDKILHLGLLRHRAHQLFCDWYRKKKVRNNAVVAVENPPEQVTSAPPDEGVTPEDDNRFREKFFKEYPVALTEAERHTIWLTARHGYTYAEAGALLGIPASTIGDIVKKARKLLADYINNQ